MRSDSNVCFGPRRGGGERDVTGTVSESSWSSGGIDGGVRIMGVYNWRKLSSWLSIIFSAIGVEGGEKVVGCMDEDKSRDERSTDKRDLPIAGIIPLPEPVLSMRSRCLR